MICINTNDIKKAIAEKGGYILFGNLGSYILMVGKQRFYQTVRGNEL